MPTADAPPLPPVQVAGQDGRRQRGGKRAGDRAHQPSGAARRGAAAAWAVRSLPVGSTEGISEIWVR